MYIHVCRYKCRYHVIRCVCCVCVCVCVCVQSSLLYFQGTYATSSFPFGDMFCLIFVLSCCIKECLGKRKDLK